MRLINKTNLLVTLFILTLLSCKNNFNINYTDINKKTAQESLNPIRPGIPDKVPFWNKYSQQFIYAPSFDVSPIKYAVEYKYTAMACDSTEYTFNSDKPYEKLSSIWDKIPVGFVKLNICGINKLGTQIGDPYTFSFYKAASFKGPYHEKVSDYKISAERALEYEFKQDYIQNWAINGTPDTASYNLYCYPSKIIGAVVETMLEYSKISEPNKEKALKIAINAADYLINISEKKGTPLEFFPPTYAGKQRTAKAFRNQFMTIYPAHTACTYLDLYDTTNRIDYKEAALNIAGTYKKLQQASGTWKLKLWSDGSPVVNNDCIPIEIIKFLDRLESQYKIKEYTDVRNKAYNWILNNALKTYNWSGQFEDVAPIEPYKNLSKDEASAFAKYLFEKKNQDKEFIKLADDLLRFCEDQFIIWEKPMPREQYNVAEWITPCVLEQYACYEPIIASTANMIDAYSAGYKATKNDIYRAKAIELANTVTVSQHADTGRYPTYWQLNERQNKESGYIDWLNCTGYCAKIMLEISAFDEMNISKNF
ncbi:hypothetical protein [Maribellus sp. YY47]|uniref:hypothetical protein n=1 Tax=Maribellus sp. YY47 TaxID=2929486 RepID=UPI002000DB41|nr:hypothetical protein [Maribellus sp. YY47]MCK3684365.1 hypothetical protein [Maribellus sp. YY47]